MSKKGAFTVADDVMMQGRQSLRDLIDGIPHPREAKPATEPVATEAEDWVSLPAHGAAYQARSRTANKPLAMLHFILADSSSRGFSYANLDRVDFLPAESPGKGPVLVLTFTGVIPQIVRITGRNLEAIRDYSGQHRIAWLRQLPPERDFLDDGEEVITSVAICRVEDQKSS